MLVFGFTLKYSAEKTDGLDFFWVVDILDVFGFDFGEFEWVDES